jgi:hypothetical protein
MEAVTCAADVDYIGVGNWNRPTGVYLSYYTGVVFFILLCCAAFFCLNVCIF